ncbi:hypothetical protein [Nocardia alni]|uniref:hypothetical protein n=1 Tax=Nocardia alni TaxID=2815723 RepID=UPI001C237BD2|nr:hypothetical protein [Nocardia alni]
MTNPIETLAERGAQKLTEAAGRKGGQLPQTRPNESLAQCQGAIPSAMATVGQDRCNSSAQ